MQITKCRARIRPFTAIVVALLAATFTRNAGAQVIYSASGTNAAGITADVDAYRTAIGALNTNVAGSFGTGRREINWDGVPDASAAPSLLPANFFNANSPRGAIFSTPGTGFMVSASSTNSFAAPISFGNIDAGYSTTFQPFSAQRMFTALGSTITDVSFFVPGSNTAALTRGFGAVFSDVDLANTTSIEYFDALNNSIGKFYAAPLAGSQSLSFLGVLYSSAIISRVRITAGNTALGAGITDQNGNARDLVVMDDFIYGEPVTSVVPEPATLLLVALGLAIVGLRKHMRKTI